MNALDVISGVLVLAGLFTVITAPVITHRFGQLAYREQNPRSSLVVDQMASELPRHTE